MVINFLSLFYDRYLPANPTKDWATFYTLESCHAGTTKSRSFNVVYGREKNFFWPGSPKSIMTP